MSNPVFPIDDPTQNLELLNTMSPESGRKIQEDGTVINIADAFFDDGGDITVRV
jgi:hypothetical protein